MSNLKNILKRAIKNGFDLSYIPDYRPRTFRNGLYDYLVESKFYCYMEDERIFVGVDILEDIAEVYLEGATMKIVPLGESGFFDLLVHLFKYIGIASKEKPEEEKTTESMNDNSSEEIWL